MRLINNILKITPIIFCFFHLQFIVNAQYENMSFEHLTLKDGLSQVTINGMIQDSHGFIWFATQDGLNRYDGVENKVYRPVFEDPETTIAGAFINYIFEDSNHDIWAATFSGLSRYDRDEDRFYNYYHNPDDTNSISNNVVVFVQSDSYNNIWVVTLGGIDKLILPNEKQDSLKVVHFSNNQPSISNLQNISGWTKDKNGNIWMSSRQNGLFRLSKKEQKKEFPTPEQFTYQAEIENSLPSNNLIALTSDTQGNIWIYSDQVFTKVITEGEKVSFINHQISGKIPRNINSLSFFIDDSGNAMCGINNLGLFVYNLKKKKLYNYKNETYNPRSLINNNITTILKDNSGVLWLGTSNGISKYNPDKNKFRHFEPQPNNPDWLRDPFVFSLCVDKNGEYWAGTNGGNGIYVYNPIEKKFRNITSKPGDKNSLQGNSIYSIFKDSEQNLWIGTNNGLSKYNYSINSFKNYQNIPGDKNSLPNNFVRCITEDKDKNLWIGTPQGLTTFNKETGKFQTWQFDDGSNIQNLRFDRKGDLWIGTFLGGLRKMVIDADSQVKFIKYQANINDSTSISNDQISGILEDYEGNIWIPTYGGGINKLDPLTNTFSLYTTKDGLPGNNFYGLLEDNNSNIWFSSSAGLTMYDIKNKTFTNYDINDGLQSNEFNGGAHHKDENGLLYFGGVNGFNVFNPDDIHTNSIAPKIAFTDFKIQNKTVRPGKSSPLKKSIQTTEQIVLSHAHRDLRFEFAALHYVSPHQNQYAYMMEGYDEDWIDLGTQNYISFKNFPHGEYVLRVKAANCDGVWNEEGISLKVIINPPFWVSWWFRIMVILLLVSCIWGYIKIRERNLRKEKEKLKEIVELRTLEIKNKNEELSQQNEEIKTINNSLGEQKVLVDERNAELYAQNEEITTQRDQLDSQHKAITDSILYAKRIQTAVLPRQTYIDEILPENFILFKPRDVVSGDFYWVRQINHHIVIAIADCTGHGVPGAIMSMLGISLINEIVLKREITQANHVLNELRKQIKQALRQTGRKGEAGDGMDMALCAFDTKTNMLQYSGAFNPLYLVQNGKLAEIKADKMPIGFYPNEKPTFTNHEIQLKDGDIFYLFSDGFIDQFGGKKGFKYKTPNFQKILKENHNKPMVIQKELLEQELKIWMQAHEQTDDILVMGVRI